MRAAAILAITLVTFGCAQADVTPTSSPTAPTNITAVDDQTEQIENWRRSHLSAFTTLGTAMTDLGDAMVANDWNTIHAKCATLADATHAMYAALPTPDERLNTAFTGALDNLNAAMIECPSLNASSDRIDANTFMTHFERAMGHMSVVKEILG